LVMAGYKVRLEIDGAPIYKDKDESLQDILKKLNSFVRIKIK